MCSYLWVQHSVYLLCTKISVSNTLSDQVFKAMCLADSIHNWGYPSRNCLKANRFAVPKRIYMRVTATVRKAVIFLAALLLVSLSRSVGKKFFMPFYSCTLLAVNTEALRSFYLIIPISIFTSSTATAMATATTKLCSTSNKHTTLKQAPVLDDHRSSAQK